MFIRRDLAERLVAELSEQDRRRLEAALSAGFADRITSLLAEERGARTKTVVAAKVRIEERELEAA